MFHTLLLVLFWGSFVLLLHSYILYPLLVKVLAARRGRVPFVQDNAQGDKTLPEIVIVMSVYNEAHIIGEKLESVLATSYPTHLWRIVIGSDGSTDTTDDIILRYAAEHPERVRLVRFGGRTGKPEIINQLMRIASHDYPTATLTVSTDANVIFTPQLLQELAAPFADAEVGLVAANVLNIGMRNEGISHHEQAYIQRENTIKYGEGIVWGNMMGAFGACYAFRTALYTPVPERFIVDDFYITLRILERGSAAVLQPSAVCYEDVSDDVAQEFRRKRRIAAGNFQNLAVLYPLLFIRRRAIGFSFLSHKVLRWCGPALLFGMLAGLAGLAVSSVGYTWVLLGYVATWLAVPLDALLKAAKIHLRIVRLLAYFYWMNIALALGFWQFVGGIQSNTWQPTKRTT